MGIQIKNLTEDCKVEQVKFELLAVSRETGRCINDKEASWYDTRLDFYIDPSNGNLSVSQDSLSAEANVEVTSVIVGCNDYAGFARFTAKVQIDGKWYTAKDELSTKTYVTIPYDLDENRIADKWEADNKVTGLSANWDEDPEPSGQANNGDGLTNYEEYRGFFVDDGNGGTDYERGDPRLKEIFVIDEGQLLDIVTWKSATGIKAHWLNLNQVYGTLGGSERDLPYRLVDFCGGYAKGSKYALNLAKRNGLNSSECGTPDAWGCSWGPPKFADITVIFPDKIREWLKAFADSSVVWLIKFPNGFSFEGINLSPGKINKYINAVKNQAKFDELVNYYTNTTVIHELGHACGVPHHCLQKINGECKRTAGVKDCPMRYVENNEFITSIEKLSEIMDLIDAGANLIVTYTKMKYCKTQDNCWSKLQVNDRVNYSKIPLN
jgi:hypothetical protein